MQQSHCLKPTNQTDQQADTVQAPNPRTSLPSTASSPKSPPAQPKTNSPDPATPIPVQMSKLPQATSIPRTCAPSLYRSSATDRSIRCLTKHSSLPSLLPKVPTSLPRPIPDPKTFDARAPPFHLTPQPQSPTARQTRQVDCAETCTCQRLQTRSSVIALLRS